MASLPITLQTPAKINLYLGVHEGRDSEGFHRVDSLTACLDVFDTVVLEDAEELSVTCVPPVGIMQEHNTCWHAARAMEREFGRSANVAIRVEKHIPDQAGLGASSSDAAAVIYGLCALWGEDPKGERAVRAARAVGSDVALFLVGSPVYLEGRGDVPVEVFPAVRESHIALIKPPQAGVNTPGAYAEFDRLPAERGDAEPVRVALREGDLNSAAAHLANNLEAVAERLVPGLAGLIEWATDYIGVLRALVTGSGTCIYCICESEAVAEKVVRAARDRGIWAQVAHVLDHGPEIVTG